jgi:penicillin amidase
MLPVGDAPVTAPVLIHWDEHQIPFVEAKADADLATALGVVHAHLRLGQMEIMRRAARGRISEVIGPAGVEIDRTVRTIGLDRAVPETMARLSNDMRQWVQCFAAGINYQIRRARAPPPELRLFGIAPEPWTADDILALGRLASADINWMVWTRLLPARRRFGEAGWSDLWRRLMDEGALPIPSLAGTATPAGVAVRLLLAFSRTGSNSVAVAAERSDAGAALIASDPHLSVGLPNLWLIAGLCSPSYRAVGLMIPGLPFIALGRNLRISWGGTNLHAASSELFDISALPATAIVEREETIRVRWWGRMKIKLRETPYGPAISDTLPFRHTPPIAMKWIGHAPSDEIGAMLAVNRAHGWESFRTALEGFAVPGQTMIYADADGRIGKLIAARLPRRPMNVPADFVSDIELAAHWDAFVTTADLPRTFNPAQGFVASANDRPLSGDVPTGFFFSSADRIARLNNLLSRGGRVSVNDLQALQRDVFLASAVSLRDLLVPRLRIPRGRNDGELRRFVDALTDWDGHYHAGSAGALAFELLLYHLVREIVPSGRLPAYRAVWITAQLVAADIAALGPERLDAALARALRAAVRGLRRFGSWGGMHRLRLAHFLRATPIIGRRFTFLDAAAAGANDTVMKTAHGLSGTRHAVQYGACARHISDMGDADRNQFCLLGGQDGWIGSSTFIDQAPLWQRGVMINVPLNIETVRQRFPHRTELLPASAQ